MCIRDYLRTATSGSSVCCTPGAVGFRLAQSVHVPGRRVAKGVLVEGGRVFAWRCCRRRTGSTESAVGVLGGGESGSRPRTRWPRLRRLRARGLPPFGRLYGLTTVVDASLAGGAEIVFVGNSRHEGVRMRYRDYEEIESPIRARFAIDADPRRAEATSTDARAAG